jgi:ABC-type amino acid transport substrate-binding protein
MKLSARLIASATSLLFVGAGPYGCSDRTNNAPSTTSIMPRVLQSRTIHAGFISYPPSFAKDANTGKFSGIYYDVLSEAATRLGLKIDYTEEEDWATMTEAVKTHRVDMVVSGIWPTSARATQADFTRPLYYSAVRAYARVDDGRFDGNAKAIDDPSVTIGVIDGEMSSVIASQDFPKAKMRSLPQTTQISQLLLELQTKKADVTFVEPAVAAEYTEHNPGIIKPISDIGPMRVFPNVILVAQNQFAFREMLNTAIDELQNNGVIDKVLRKYEAHKGDFLRVALPYSP